MAKKDATQPGASDQKAKTDWESIEREYRAGVLSIKEIGRLYDVSDTAIRKKAKGDEKKGIAPWKRDLTSKVQEEVRASLVRAEVRAANAEDQARTERQIVEQAAATVVEVVRSHRRDISTGRQIVGTLMQQLLDVAGRRDEFEEAIYEETKDDKTTERRSRLMRAVSIPAHAGTMRDLSNAMKNLVALERQAFNVNGGEEEPPEPDTPAGDQVAAKYERMRAAANKRLGRA